MIKNSLSQTSLMTKDFYYDLPPELIAQTPAEPRDSSRLLVLHKESGEREHKVFSDIIDYLNEGDVLVINACTAECIIHLSKTTGWSYSDIKEMPLQDLGFWVSEAMKYSLKKKESIEEGLQAE